MSPGPRLLPLTLLALLAQAPAQAHPHVFIDGGVDFLFDAQGRLAQLRVTWAYDAMTTLLMLGDLGIDAQSDADLGPEARARLAAYDTSWDVGPEYDGDSYLWDGDRLVGLSGPISPTARLHGGLAEISFLRQVETPFRPGQGTVVKVYDPEYYTAFAVTNQPKLEGDAQGCHARVERFKPTPKLNALLDELSTVPIGETPAQEVGELLADKVHIACE